MKTEERKLKRNLRGYLLGFLSATFLISGVAYAASNTKTIEAIYDNIKVYKDNVLCETRDANGNVVEPFIYNGTTYMPVRGTANLAGMDVTWDGETKSIYLWDELTAEDTYLLDVCMPYEVNYFHTHIASNGNNFEMAGKKYSNGLTCTHYGQYLIRGDNYALFNLDSKYSTLSCVVGHTSENGKSKTVTFIVDGKSVKTVELEEECMPKKVSIPLKYGLQMKIVSSAEIGIGNMIVK